MTFKLDYLGHSPEKVLETLETEPLYGVTLFNCISQEKGAMAGRTGQDVQQKKPSRKLFINKSNESVSNKQEYEPIQNNKAFVGQSFLNMQNKLKVILGNVQ